MLNRPLPQRLISLLGGGLLLVAVAGFVLLVLRPAFLPEGSVQAPVTLTAPDLEALEQAAAEAEVCGHDLDLEGALVEARIAFGLQQGLTYPYAFAQVTTFLQQRGRLPDCYMTKAQARDLGWKSSGRTIDDIDPDGAVGGDTFGNREGLLPTRPANSYAVADLDYVEGYRGAARIVYDRRRTGEGAIWITVDHYDSFTAVPVGQ